MTTGTTYPKASTGFGITPRNPDGSAKGLAPYSAGDAINGTAGDLTSGGTIYDITANPVAIATDAEGNTYNNVPLIVNPLNTNEAILNVWKGWNPSSTNRYRVVLWVDKTINENAPREVAEFEFTVYVNAPFANPPVTP